MNIRTYLIVVSILLSLSLGAGVYVWYVYQSVQSSSDVTPLPDHESQPPITEDGKEGYGEQAPEKTSEAVSEPAPEPFVLTAESLTPAQRGILETFGMGDARVVVDDALLSCVSDAIGDTRLLEITEGSAPSPLEAIKIAACL